MVLRVLGPEEVSVPGAQHSASGFRVYPKDRSFTTTFRAGSLRVLRPHGDKPGIDSPFRRAMSRPQGPPVVVSRHG